MRLHGEQNREGVSAALPGRSARSCRLRWCQHLAPGVAAGRPFSAEEDALIVACHRAHPNKWATITPTAMAAFRAMVQAVRAP